MTVSARERRLLALTGLLAGVALLRWVWVAATPPAAAPAPRARAGRAVLPPGAAMPEQVVAVRTDLLAAEPRPFEVGRNLFQFGSPPPPPPPSAAELAAQRQAAEARRQRAAEAARLADIPRPPEITVRYLGTFGPERKRIAVFQASDGKSVVNALEGDLIEGKFVVVKIGLESVDVGFVGFPDAAPRRLAPRR